MESEAAPLVAGILGRIAAHGHQAVLTPALAAWLAQSGTAADLPVLPPGPVDPDAIDFFLGLGGDGTFLDTVARGGHSGIPVLGINLGRLGFLSSVRIEEVDQALEALAQGRYAIHDRSMLQATGPPELEGLHDLALNEVSVTKLDSASMIAVEVFLGQEFLNTYWADGLIVSTPTGSTAYSMSCGGPIMHPANTALAITPINAHNLNVRPFVVPDHYTVHLRVDGRDDRCLLNLDSRGVSIGAHAAVTVRKAPTGLRVVQLEGQDFLHTLRAKLNWGLDLRGTLRGR
jgi:NAD+ kinase